METVELGTYLQRMKGSGNIDEEGCQDSDKAIIPYQNRQIDRFAPALQTENDIVSFPEISRSAYVIK